MTGVCLPNRNIALASLRREGVKSYMNSKVLEVTEHEVKIQHKDGTEEWLKGFDYIVPVSYTHLDVYKRQPWICVPQ